MIRIILIIGVAAISAISGTAQGWIQLFNTKNLEGWTAYGTEKWYVDNNQLVCESGPDKGYGYLSLIHI